jgi:hypothetical protein
MGDAYSKAEAVRGSSTMMRVSKAGALTMTFIAVLWAVTPAIACLVPTQQMTPSEHACCVKMAQQCGSSAMPASHSCCLGHRRDSAVSPVPSYAPNRPLALAIVPPSFILLIDFQLTSPMSEALEAPPPESSSGGISVLRI